MKTRFWTVLSLVLIPATALLCATPVLAQVAMQQHPQSSQARTVSEHAAAFTPNVGQISFVDGTTASHVDAMFSSNNTTAFVHRRGVSLVQQRIHIQDRTNDVDKEMLRCRNVSSDVARTDLVLIGANPKPRMSIGDHSGSYERYFLGGSTSAEGMIAPNFKTLTYHEVWPGIDARYRIVNGTFKYEFIVHPGADVHQIAMNIVGSPFVQVDRHGILHYATVLGSLSDNKPYSYTINGKDTNVVHSSYSASGQRITFDLGEYDRNTTLVIDPQARWATYFGGNNNVVNQKITFDPDGSVYFAGSTFATNLPTVPGMLQRTHKGNTDVFICKFSDRGKYRWCTYYGGSGTENMYDIQTDDSNNVWVVGNTDSKNFPQPVTGSGPVGDPDSIQSSDGFVIKLTEKGAWSDGWMIWGEKDECVTGIAIRKDKLVITGWTYSPLMSGVTGSPNRRNMANDGNNCEIFLLQLKPAGNGIRWTKEFLTYIGGDGDEYATHVRFDPDGNTLIGATSAPPSTFPGTVRKGGTDPVILKYTGSTHVWTRLIGSGQIEDMHGMTVDKSGAVVACGYTIGADFPLVNTSKTRKVDSSAGWLCKLSSAGNVVFSTYFDGTGYDEVRSVSCDALNNIWVGVHIAKDRYKDFKISKGPEDDWPTTPDAFARKVSGRNPAVGNTPDRTGAEGYFAKLTPDGRTLLYGSYYGGPSQNPMPEWIDPEAPPDPPRPTSPTIDFGIDYIDALSVEGNSAYIWLASSAWTKRMPVTANAFQDSADLYQDTSRVNSFITRFSFCNDSVIHIGYSGNLTICDNGSMTLHAPDGFARYLWSTGARTKSIVVTEPGTYEVGCTLASGCRYYDSVTVVRNPLPHVAASRDTTICRNEMVQLVATASGGKPPYSYKWNRIEAGPDFLSNDAVAQPNANPGTTSSYEVLIMDSNGCIAKDTTIVAVQDPRPAVTPTTIQAGSIKACNTSIDAEIVITNPMSYEIMVTGIVDPSQRVSAVTSFTNPIVITAGSETTLTVRITPNTVGLSSGVFSLAGAPCNWSLNVAYTITKEAASSTITPSLVNFGSHPFCGVEVYDTTIVIHNDSSGELTVQEPSGISSTFTTVSPTFPITIQAGDSAVVMLRYSPPASGTYTTLLVFPYASSSCTDSFRVRVSGRNTQPQLSRVTDIDLGMLSGCESSRDTSIILQNTGENDLEVVFDDVPGIAYNPSGPYSIATGDSITIRVQVSPTQQGTYNAIARYVAQPCNLRDSFMITAVKSGAVVNTPSVISMGEIIACGDTTVMESGMVTYLGSGEATIADITIGPSIRTTNLVAGMKLANAVGHPFDVIWQSNVDGILIDSVVLTIEPCSIRKVIRIEGGRTSRAVTALSPDVLLGDVNGSYTGTCTFVNSGTATFSANISVSSGDVVINSMQPPSPVDIKPGEAILVNYTISCTAGDSIHEAIHCHVDGACRGDAVTSISGTCVGSPNVTSRTVVSLPSIIVNTGDQFLLPLHIDSSNGLTTSLHTNWEAVVEYHPGVIVGREGTPDCFVSHYEPCSITVSGRRGMDTLGVLDNLKFTAILGTQESTSVTVTSFKWLQDSMAVVVLHAGHVTIGNICREGSVRLLQPDSALNDLTIRSIVPQPARSTVHIVTEKPLPRGTTFMVYNSIGERVAEGLLNDNTIDVSHCTAGSYVVRIVVDGYQSTMSFQKIQ